MTEQRATSRGLFSIRIEGVSEERSAATGLSFFSNRIARSRSIDPGAFECLRRVSEGLEGIFIDRMEQNEDITACFMNDQGFQDIVGKPLLEKVHEQVRREGTTSRCAGKVHEPDAEVEPFQRVRPERGNRRTDTGDEGSVSHDEYGHNNGQDGVIGPHYNVDGTHYMYPSSHNPANNR